MKISQTNYDNSQTNCCAPLNLKDWDQKEISWKDKLFIKDRIRSFFHIPINFGSVMGRIHSTVEKSEAYPEQPLWLSDENSLWGSDIYLAIDQEIEKANVVKLSGTFLTKVFEGPFKNVGNWIKEMNAYVATKDAQVKQFYFFYATCPKCAKHFGKNYVVLFAQVN